MKGKSKPMMPAKQNGPKLVPKSQTGQKSAKEIQHKYSGSQKQKTYK